MNTYAIIAEPNRRQLLDVLLEGAKPVNALVEVIGMSQPVVSKHLGILREAGLVQVTREGQRRLYSINCEPLRELDSWLMPYREFWSQRLDALSQHLDDNQEGDS